MPERFIVDEQPWYSEDSGWRVVDRDGEIPDIKTWTGEIAERVAKLLNRGCRAEREDECLA
jgi:hypothetical protein